jgi:hypothetical protein
VLPRTAILYIYSRENIVDFIIKQFEPQKFSQIKKLKNYGTDITLEKQFKALAAQIELDGLHYFVFLSLVNRI